MENEEKKESVESTQKTENNTSGGNKRPIIIIAVVVGVLLIFGCVISCGKQIMQTSDELNKFVESDQPATGDSKGQVTTTKRELTESELMLTKIVALFKEKLAFDTGNYIQGEVPAGDYAFVKFSGSGSYYCEKDGSGDIIDNENFSSFGYVKVHAAGNLETRGALINVTAFEKLGVTSAKEIYEKLNNQTNYNQAGYYKVGVDIEPGRYIVESMGRGYWAIMSGPVGNSDIVDNDNYQGKATINLRDGQYLELSRSTITKAE